VTAPSRDEVLKRFEFHPATETTGPLHEDVRDRCGDLAEWMVETLPAGRHQALAISAVQEAMMWANAAVAIDSPA
jgi:hypothetical protein